jgi:photosystem II stability/assembly factor-like uncharacterized protein
MRKSRLKLIIITIAIVFFLSGCVQEDTSEDETNNGSQTTTASLPDIEPMVWQKSNGPGGGKIIDVAIDPEIEGVLYTATYPLSKGLLDGGVFKSVDGGESWERKTDKVNDKETWSISLDPNDNTVLWVGTNSGEIYKSTDSAESWILKKEMSGDINVTFSDTIYSIEIDPFDSNHVLAGSRWGNLFLTNDGGETWEKIYQEKGLTASGVISDITFHPDHEDIVFLTTGFFDVWDFIGTGIYKSTDGGSTWRKLENGLEDKTQFGDLVIDPSDTDVIYAANGMENNPTMGVEGEDLAYLYRSEDLGESWERIDIGSQLGRRTLNAVAVHPTDSDKIYVMGQDQFIAISEDRGETWEQIRHSGIIGIGTFVEYDPHDTSYNTMYSTTYAAGIFKSTDAGRTWEDLNGLRISFAYVEGMLADPVNKGYVYSQSFENGFHFSSDFGTTWDRGDVSGNYWAWDTFVEKSDGSDNIYVVNRGGGNIKKTSSLAGQWELIDIVEDSDEGPFPFFLKADSDNNLYVATNNDGIYKSINSGNIWDEINNGLPSGLDVRTIDVDPNNNDLIYAGSVGEKGRIWVSDDAGASWDILNDEMTFTTIHAMAVDPNNENVVYAAPWGAPLYKTEDGGDSWDVIGGKGHHDMFSIASVKVDPFYSPTVFAASRANHYFYRSDDSGSSWYMPWGISEEYFRLNSITLDPNNPETYYVSAFKMAGPVVDGDLFRKEPEEHIELITDDLPRAVLDIEVDPDDSSTLYASTHVYGLYKSTNRGEDWEELDFPRAGIFDLAFNNDKLYATTNCGELPENLLFGLEQHDGSCGVYVSEDSGDSWTNLLPENMQSTAVKAIDFVDDAIYIATNNDAYVSTDEGETWTPLLVPFKETATIAVTQNKIYVGTHGGGVYQSEREDINWKSNGLYVDISNIQIHVDPSDSDTIYATSFPGGVFKSTDRGLNWNEKNFALPSFRVEDTTKQAYYNLVIDKTNSDNIYLSLFGKGVYRSIDGADYWIPINTNLDNFDIYVLSLDASGKVLYAGTNGGSIYRMVIK